MQESIRVRDGNLVKLPVKMNTGGSWEPQPVLWEGAGRPAGAAELGTLPYGLVRGNGEEATKAGPSSHGFLRRSPLPFYRQGSGTSSES